MNQKSTILQGSILKSLITFTLSILFALVLQMTYGMVDLFIVGQFSTVEDIAGVTIGSIVMNMLVSSCNGFAMGTTVLLGQKIGEGKQDEAGAVVGNSVLFFIISGLVITLGMIVPLPSIVQLLNTPPEAVPHTTAYLFYGALGVVPVFAYNLLGSVFRGIGDSKTPLLAVGIACIINIIGDFILVAYFDMGAEGAAIATVFAQTMSVLISVYIISRKNLPFHFSKASLKYDSKVFWHTLRLGFPLGIQNLLISFTFVALTMIANQFGVAYSAAIGVSEKVSGIFYFIPFAFMQSLSAYVAQNYGAMQLDRGRKATQLAMGICLICCSLLAYLSFYHGDMLIGIFNDSPDVMEYGGNYMASYAFDVFLCAFLLCAAGFFNGIGQTTFVMAQGLIGALLVRLPLAYLFSIIYGSDLFMIGLATPIGSVVQLTICLGYYLWFNKRLKKLELEHQLHKSL